MKVEPFAPDFTEIGSFWFGRSIASGAPMFRTNQSTSQKLLIKNRKYYCWKTPVLCIVVHAMSLMTAKKTAKVNGSVLRLVFSGIQIKLWRSSYLVGVISGLYIWVHILTLFSEVDVVLGELKCLYKNVCSVLDFAIEMFAIRACLLNVRLPWKAKRNVQFMCIAAKRVDVLAYPVRALSSVWFANECLTALSVYVCMAFKGTWISNERRLKAWSLSCQVDRSRLMCEL